MNDWNKLRESFTNTSRFHSLEPRLQEPLRMLRESIVTKDTYMEERIKFFFLIRGNRDQATLYTRKAIGRRGAGVGEESLIEKIKDYHEESLEG